MVEINGIGVKPDAGSSTQWVKREQDDPRCGRSPTLAERARKLVTEINEKMVSEARSNISAYVLKYPTKQAYIFDMKRFVGRELDLECTEKAYLDLADWLSAEGFTFDTQRNKTAALLATSFSSSRRVQSSGSNFGAPGRDGYSEFTYYITW